MLRHLRVGDGEDLVGNDALAVDDVLGDAVELLQRLRVVDVAVLDLDDHRHDVGAAEHLPEVVVDLDVRIRPRVDDRLDQAADCARLPFVAAQRRTRRRRSGTSDRSRRSRCAGACLKSSTAKNERDERDDDGDRTPVLQEKAQVRFNPSLRNHGGTSIPAAVNGLQLAVLFAVRDQDQTSLPTMIRPSPLWFKLMSRNQFAASSIGRLTRSQLAPPLVLRSRRPLSPTAQPIFPRTAIL